MNKSCHVKQDFANCTNEHQFTCHKEYYSDPKNSCFMCFVALEERQGKKKQKKPWWCHWGYVRLCLRLQVFDWKPVLQTGAGEFERSGHLIRLVGPMKDKIELGNVGSSVFGTWPILELKRIFCYMSLASPPNLWNVSRWNSTLRIVQCVNVKAFSVA